MFSKYRKPDGKPEAPAPEPKQEAKAPETSSASGEPPRAERKPQELAAVPNGQPQPRRA
jgi:hypothetical protein